MSEINSGPKIDASTINSFVQLVAAANSANDDGTAGAAILRGVMDQAGLPSEQTALLETVGRLGATTTDVDDRDIEQRRIDRLLDFAERETPRRDWRGETDMYEFADNETEDAATQEGQSEEIEDLRALNDTLASALGACPMCWGGVDDCEVCSGAGMPGSQAPDRRLFKQLVFPALRRMQQEGESVRRPHPHQSNESGLREET